MEMNVINIKTEKLCFMLTEQKCIPILISYFIVRSIISNSTKVG